MAGRKPLFIDTDTGLLTETGRANTIDLTTMPWLEALIFEVSRFKAALRFLGADPEMFEPDFSILLGA